MPGLVPGIHVLRAAVQGVDGRDKPGHDDEEAFGAMAPAAAKYKTTRKGGIPSGSLEVLGGLSETVCQLYRDEVFPLDVVFCFNCFVGGNSFVSGDGAGNSVLSP